MDTIKQVIANILKIPPARISDDTAMGKTAEWDSLKHIEIILELEQQLGIELTGDEIAEMTSIRAIESVLRRRGV